MKNLLQKDNLMKYKSLIGLIVFSFIITLINPNFLSISNILNVLRQTSINSIIAVGMTFVILTGGIDLSVGSVLAISSAIAAAMLAAGYNIVIVIPIALLVGIGIGVINGIIISKGKVQAFIATLAMMTLARGYTLVFTDGKPINLGEGSSADTFTSIGSGYVAGIPIPIIITGVVFIIAYYVLKHTRFGRYVFAMGGNEEATKLSGINVVKNKIMVYAISGGMAALAGIIVTARLSSAQPQAGSGYELDAIAAVVLGGTSLAGGVGSILGTLIGALIIGILNNSLNLMNVSSYYQLLAKGLVILVAVLVDRKNK